MLEVTVEPGGSSGEEPRAFYLSGHRQEIEAMLDHWPGSGHLYLKVRVRGGAIYILRREDATGRWELRLFHGGREPPLSGA
ncbi:hypothetical protein [Thiohalorhabdus methylotrophus]|uniref:Uncharacterized protein n=1 Tax=Thiohalorhabdus methylotrophus TaxID=3242694 RepID=A0ABV4TY00_9GAMM